MVHAYDRFQHLWVNPNYVKFLPARQMLQAFEPTVASHGFRTLQLLTLVHRQVRLTARSASGMLRASIRTKNGR